MPLPAFSFELTTVTTTFTLPNGLPFTGTFTAPPETTFSSVIPIFPGLSATVTFTVPDLIVGGCGGRKGDLLLGIHQDDLLARRDKPLHRPDSNCPTDTSTPAQAPLPFPPPTASATPTSSIQPSPTPTTRTSQGPPPPRSTESSDAQGNTRNHSTTTATIAGSSSRSPLPASLGPSSVSRTPTANESTYSTSAPTQPSSAAPASRLSAGATVGIALGVVAAAGIFLVAALFLFIHKRRGRRYRGRTRDSMDSDSTQRQLTSEDTRRRALSSTWSWFGSVPITSEPDHSGYGYDGGSPHSREIPFHEPNPEKGTSISNSEWKHAPIIAHIQTPLASPLILPTRVEHAHSGLTPPPWSRTPREPAREKGVAQLLALVEQAFSHSNIPPNSNSSPSRAGEEDSEGPTVLRNAGRDGIGVQQARDPFADPPRASGISQTSTAIISGDVSTIEAL